MNNEEEKTTQQPEETPASETEKEVPETEAAKAEEKAEAKADPTEELNKKVASLEDQLLRKVAEFDNYRKRTNKEKEEIGLTARVKCIAELLPVLDTLERALGIGCSDEEFKRGIQLTYDNMVSILTKMGVEEIKAQGEVFDPNLHYAVSRVENPEFGENVVAAVMQKGYTLSGKVIRHAMVAVANT